MTLKLAARAKASVLHSDDAAIAAAHEVAAWLARGAVERDRDRPIPWTEMKRLSDSGLLAIGVPRRHGGCGAAWSTIAEVIRILSVADPAIGQLPQNHFLFAEAIQADGDELQTSFFLSEILRGARLGNAQAERGGGSALDLRTRLVPEGDGHRLHGDKYYCTGALLADWIPVAAIDAQERQVLALVDASADGVEMLADWNALGQRTTFSGTVHFRDVHVRADQVIPHWKLFERVSAFHAFGTFLHAAVDVGAARAAVEDTVRLIAKRSRPRLGAPAGSAVDDPLAQLRLGRLIAELHALEALLKHAGLTLDRARQSESETAVADATIAALGVKALAETIGLDAAAALFALAGTSATDQSLGLDRHWRNLRVHSVHDANDWRLAQIGTFAVHGTPPAKPSRRLNKG